MQIPHQSLERRHLQLLVALAETGRLGRAAEVLSISPSAASHRLREAERRLGVAIVEPEGRSLRLTPAGTNLARAAEMAETTLRAGEEASRWMGSTARATVRLALDFYDRAPWLFRYGGQAEFPFRVDLVRVPYGGSADAIARGVADVAVWVTSEAGASDRLLDTDELAAAVPADHPAATRGRFLPEEIASLPYLTAGDRPEPGFEFDRFLSPAGAYPHEMIMIESVSAILQLVAAGRGLTIQPRLALLPAFDNTAVIPLDDVTVPVRWEVLTRPDPGPDTQTLVAALNAMSAMDGTGRPVSVSPGPVGRS